MGAEASRPRSRSPAPPHATALLVMEMQRGVVGDLASIPELARAVEESGAVAAIGTLLDAARAAGVTVIHCHAAFPADRSGVSRNIPMLDHLLRDPDYLVVGSDAAQGIPELAPRAGDRVRVRHHGMSPFTGTELHAELRALGIEAVAATGVSLNVGIVGLGIEAVNLGYRLLVPGDCVVGVPESYGRDVLRHTLRPIATLTDAAELAATWTSA